MAQNVKRTLEQGVILVTNGAAAKSAGQLVVSGERVCLLKEDAEANQTDCPAFVKDVEIEYAKLSTDVVAEGVVLYFDSTNDRLTITAASWKKAGTAAAAAGSGVATQRLHLGLIR